MKRLRKKNTELAIIAKRLEDRARKLQEANLKVVRFSTATLHAVKAVAPNMSWFVV